MELTLLKYLSNRYQVTACNNRTKQLLYRSEYHKAPSLGLFCLQYTLTTYQTVWNSVTLLYTEMTPFRFQSKLNSDLDKGSKWLISNQLNLNINKTKFIIIGSSQRLQKLNSISTTTDDKSIEEVSFFLYLGVV